MQKYPIAVGVVGFSSGGDAEGPCGDVTAHVSDRWGSLYGAVTLVIVRVTNATPMAATADVLANALGWRVEFAGTGLFSNRLQICRRMNRRAARRVSQLGYELRSNRRAT